MNWIDELIQQNCPNGVAFRAIGEFSDCSAGGTPPSGIARYWENGTIPWMSSGEVNKGTISDTDKKITKEGFNSCSTKMLPPDIVVIALAGQGKTRGLVARTRISLCTNQSLAAIVPKELVTTDFLYYYLQTQYQQLRSASSGDGTRGGLNLQILRNYRIPVPPIEVQQEIVKVLDTFSKLEAELAAELAAELEARRSQYTFYRDQLLTFDESETSQRRVRDESETSQRRVRDESETSQRRVRWAKLTDICINISSGGTPLVSRSAYYEGGDIPWLRTQEVIWRDIYDTEMRVTKKAIRETAAKWIPENCVIIAISGATAARAAVNKIPLTTNQHCCNLQIDDSQASYRYVFHWVSANYEQLKALGRGARADLNTALIKSFPMPVPPREEQDRIVAILDKFDALVNDLSIGLPVELKARRQQYEYYRDRLLTFQEEVKP